MSGLWRACSEDVFNDVFEMLYAELEYVAGAVVDNVSELVLVM